MPENLAYAACIDELLAEPINEFLPFEEYDPDGQCFEHFVKPDPHYAEWRGASLTVYRSRETHEIVGWTAHEDPGLVILAENDLDELARLEPNWDGYGAPTIDKEILAAARRFLRTLYGRVSLRPRVVPMSTGSLQFEWHNGSKSLELEFEDARIIHYLQWHPEEGVKEEAIFDPNETDRAVNLIQWLISGT